MKIHDLLEIDYPLLLSAAALSVIGILFIYSSGLSSVGEQTSTEFRRQIVWSGIGFSIAVSMSLFDYKLLKGLSPFLYFFTLLMILYTIIFGRYINGARAWINIASIGGQPSEFAKLTTIILLARFLSDSKDKMNELLRFLAASAIAGVPMLLVLVQPDFGTSLVFVPILLLMCFVSGIQLRYVLFILLIIVFTISLMVLPLWQDLILHRSFAAINLLKSDSFIVAGAIAFSVIGAIALSGFLLYKKSYFFWIAYACASLVFSLVLAFVADKVMQDYQKQRLIVFLDPNIDPRDSGWNIIQSAIAIGSGGLWGRGYLQGTQSHYRFLPQQSTDFIFSIFSEEWGFVRGLLVFALFMFICLRLIRIMKLSPDPFGAYIVSGLSGVYIFHFLINVGMTMGIMPITGIPLLFMSYGGSAMVSAMMGIGLALSIYVRRNDHFF